MTDGVLLVQLSFALPTFLLFACFWKGSPHLSRDLYLSDSHLWTDQWPLEISWPTELLVTCRKTLVQVAGAGSLSGKSLLFLHSELSEHLHPLKHGIGVTPGIRSLWGRLGTPPPPYGRGQAATQGAFQ